MQRVFRIAEELIQLRLGTSGSAARPAR